MAVPLQETASASWTARGIAEGLLLGQAAPVKGRPIDEVDVLQIGMAVMALLAVLLVAVLAFFLITRWRKQAAEQRLSASDQLSEFRELYEQGQLSREEFERLRSLLGARLREEIKVAPPPSSAEPARPPRQRPPDEPPPTGIRPA